MNDVDGTYNCKIQMVTSTSGRYRKIKVNNTNKKQEVHWARIYKNRSSYLPLFISRLWTKSDF